MKQLILTIGNQDVIFDLLSTDIAVAWSHEINQMYGFHETDRFQGWPDDTRDLEWFKYNLQSQIDIVNNYIPNTITDVVTLDQSELNYLHKFFEDLRGGVEIGTVFYNESPLATQQAIDKFNILIHECEHFLRNSMHPSIVVTFKDRPRKKLQVADFRHFTFKWEFGTIYINYCEVGKPLLDVFKDNDTFIGKSNIRPLEYYSADFMIKFGPSTTDEVYENRKTQIFDWLSTQDCTFDNLSLGLIPVATLNRDQFTGMGDTDIINKISIDKRITTVCIK